MCVREISGMKMMTGCLASGSNSPDVASTNGSGRVVNNEYTYETKKPTRNMKHVPGPFYHGKLEAKTDTEEGYFLFARILDCEHHSIRTAQSKATGDEDPVCADDGAPGVVVFRWTGFLGFGIEIG